jgi:tripartite-type tricarboxylate transporter receptor subunit TctC
MDISRRAALSAVALALPSLARADAVFSRPVRLIVTFAPGGGSDVTARLLAPGISEALGVPVVVENRAGAGGSVGTVELARAAPDGHTIAVVSSSHVTNPILMSPPPYHATRDITAITNVISAPNSITVAGRSPFRTLPDLIAAARARPGTMSYATSGVGTAQHIGGARLSLLTQSDLVHVPYRGGGPANAATIAGETDFGLSNFASMMPHVASGGVRMLAVAAPRRVALAPDVPTVAEALNLPGYDSVEWYGVIAPAGLPRAYVERIDAAVRGTARRPEVAQRFETLGTTPILDGPEAFLAFLQEQNTVTSDIVRAANIRIQ